MPQMTTIGERLRSALRVRDAVGLTDGQLLRSFIERRDEDAVESLVRRHGPMVLGVCRRILGRSHDAEDAFQATFLVLVRRATSVVPPELVGNWLHGVAYRTALEARARNARRRAREKQVKDMPHPQVEPEAAWQDIQPLLDEELRRLPEKYRVPVVLCELEGRSRKEVAGQLNLPEGTLSSRLATARRMLAGRLARRGVTLSAGVLATVLSQNAVTAAVPLPLVVSTVKAATLIAAGSAAASVVSANVAALTEGVLKAMFLTKLKVTTLAMVAVGVLLGAGVCWITPQAQAEKPADKVVNDPGTKEVAEVSGVIKAVDVARGVVILHPSKVSPEEQTFTLQKDARVFLDDGTGDKLGFQDGKVGNLTDGDHVTLRLEQKEVVRVWVDGPSVQGILKALDPAKNTITATISMTKGEPPVDKTFTVARNAKLSIEDGKAKDKTKPVKAPTLADLPADAVVTLRLSADRKVVGNIRAEGQSVVGILKAVDPAKSTITLSVTVTKGEPAVDRTFTVDKDASVFIEGNKDKSKADNLGDVPAGAVVTLRLSLDQKTVVAVRADGVSVHGTVKAVAKDSITLHDKDAGEKTYAVAKDAVVYLDGQPKAMKLADVPVEAVVDLKMLPDQSAVREIRATGPTAYGVVSGKVGPDSITVQDKEGEKSFSLSKEVTILIEDKGKGTLADLIEGTVTALRLSADKSAVLDIYAQGPSFHGTVKGIDPDKNTITLTIGAKNGEGGEDKEFKTSKDTVVQTEINGARLKLSDLRVGKDVVLRLSIDQKAASRITLLGE